MGELYVVNKKMLRKLQINKGWMAALLVLFPYIVATTKFTFFYRSSIDGVINNFVVYSFSLIMIECVGGPLSLVACLTMILDRK